MVENNRKNLPQKRQDSGLSPQFETTFQDALLKLPVEQQAEVTKKLADEGVRLRVKEYESRLDVEIFDEQARTVIGIVRDIARDPTVSFRAETTHQTKEGNTRVVVGRGCLNVLLVLIVVFVLMSIIF